MTQHLQAAPPPRATTTSKRRLCDDDSCLQPVFAPPNTTPMCKPKKAKVTSGTEKGRQPTSKSKSARRARTASNHQDLLAAYIDELRSIPPFTHAQERETAQQLESLDLQTWQWLLQLPKAVEVLDAELEGSGLDEIRAKTNGLHELYATTSRASTAKLMCLGQEHRAYIERLGAALRVADCDKEIQDRVVEKLHQSALDPHVTDVRPTFRCHHRDLDAIDTLRRKTLEVRNRFVRGNLRLVISVARGLHGRGLTFVDSIQEGNVGLVKAIHRFDHRRGFRFSTYAHWWVRHSIMRAMVNCGSPVRLPVHVADLRRRIEKARGQLMQTLGRAATIPEIANHLRKRVDEVQRVINEAPAAVVSLDETLGDEDRRSHVDVLGDDEAAPVDEVVIQRDISANVAQAMGELTALERDVILRRFGLNDDHDETLDSVSKVHNLSRERVRQVQQQGLTKLRRMCKRQRLGPSW